MLTQGINGYFPNTNPETKSDDRFFVYLKDYGSSTYIVVDEDFNITQEIGCSMLENPKFNLIKWHLDYLMENNLFYKQYQQLHRLCYDTTFREDNQFYEMPGLIYVESIEILERVAHTLEKCKLFPGDDVPVDQTYQPGDVRFVVELSTADLVCIYDRVQGFETYIQRNLAGNTDFSIGKWFVEQCALNNKRDAPWIDAHRWMVRHNWVEMTINDLEDHKDKGFDLVTTDQEGMDGDGLELRVIQVDRNKYVTMQQNAARAKMDERLLPRPVIIKISIDNQPARALIDSGSLGDFISSTLVDQLKLKRMLLDTAVGLQLAVQGSRSKINSTVNAWLTYQNIEETQQFDIVNLNDYDVILGTPFMYQHQVCIGLNPARIVIGSDKSVPIIWGTDTKYLLGGVDFTELRIMAAHNQLMAYAEPIC